MACRRLIVIILARARSSDVNNGIERHGFDLRASRGLPRLAGVDAIRAWWRGSRMCCRERGHKQGK